MVINMKSICLYSQVMYTTGKEGCTADLVIEILFSESLLSFLVSRHSLNLLVLIEAKIFAVFEGSHGSWS